jgi:hypothetical protein
MIGNQKKLFLKRIRLELIADCLLLLLLLIKHKTIIATKGAEHYLKLITSTPVLANKLSEKSSKKVRSVFRVARLFKSNFATKRFTCLAYAFSIRDTLNRYGIFGTVHVAVRKDGKKIRAHAWYACNNYRFGYQNEYTEVFTY